MILQSELVWIVIVTIIASITIFYSLFNVSKFSVKVQEIFRFSTFDDLALKSLSNLYNAKFQILEKTYLQMAIDSLLYLKRYKKEIDRVKKELNLGDKVFYGMELGAYNVSDTIYSMFDNLIGKNRWQLIIYYDENFFHVYGYEIKNLKELKSYVLPIPIPDGELGYVILKVI